MPRYKYTYIKPCVSGWWWAALPLPANPLLLCFQSSGLLISWLITDTVFFFLTCKTVPFVAKRLAATSWLTCPLLTGPASHLTPNIIKETPSFILDFITIQHNKKQTNKQTLFPVPSRLHLGLLCTKTSPHLSVTATYCESLIHFFDLTDCVQSFSQRSERLPLIAASHQI